MADNALTGPASTWGNLFRGMLSTAVDTGSQVALARLSDQQAAAVAAQPEPTPAASLPPRADDMDPAALRRESSDTVAKLAPYIPWIIGGGVAVVVLFAGMRVVSSSKG